MVALMTTITHFGATLLLLPFALAVALWLGWRVGVRQAGLWCACVAGVAGLVAVSKILLTACGAAIADIQSPSGHSAAATMIYGGFTVIAMGRSRSARSIAFRIAIGLWVLLIGISRVVLGVHTVGDVGVGWLIGVAGLLLFARGYRSDQRPPYALAGGLLLAVATVALLMPGQTFTLEPWFHWLAAQLQAFQPLLCAAAAA